MCHQWWNTDSSSQSLGLDSQKLLTFLICFTTSLFPAEASCFNLEHTVIYPSISTMSNIYTYVHTHIHTSRGRIRSEVGDSELIPFDESPVFGITPADDQYVYGQQNWSDYTISFGFNNPDEHAFDEHAFDEHTFDEHSFDKHLFDEEQFDDTLTTID